MNELLEQLISAGLITESEAIQLQGRKTARDLAAQIVRLVQELSPWPVIHLSLKTEAWAITFDGQTTAVVPVKPRSRTVERQGTARAARETSVEGIPANVWKDACERAGVRYYGPRASARNGRVKALAIQIARERGLIA